MKKTALALMSMTRSQSASETAKRSTTCMIPPIVAVPAAMAPVVMMMASRAIPAMMVTTIGRLGDTRAEQRKKRDGAASYALKWRDRQLKTLEGSLEQ